MLLFLYFSILYEGGNACFRCIESNNINYESNTKRHSQCLLAYERKRTFPNYSVIITEIEQGCGPLSSQHNAAIYG